MNKDPAARTILFLMIIAIAMVSCGSMSDKLDTMDLTLTPGAFAQIAKALNNNQ